MKMKIISVLLLLSVFYSSCYKCNQILRIEQISVFKFVNFAPEDIDTVYFINFEEGHNVPPDLNMVFDIAHRYIPDPDEMQIELLDGLRIGGEMHIFASDTSLHYVVKPTAISVINERCGAESYIDSVSVNNISQKNSRKVTINK